jgi:predicted small lipoprotein YifL
MRRLCLAVTLAIALATGGCGQKGPLYLPDKNAKVVTAPAAGTTPATPTAAPPAAPAEAPATPQTPPAPKPNDKDQDPQSPPK